MSIDLCFDGLVIVTFVKWWVCVMSYDQGIERGSVKFGTFNRSAIISAQLIDISHVLKS